MNCPRVSASNLNRNLTYTSPVQPKEVFPSPDPETLGVSNASLHLNSTGWDSLTSTAIKVTQFLSLIDFWLGNFYKILMNFPILIITYLQSVKFSVRWEAFFLLKGFEWVCIFVTIMSNPNILCQQNVDLGAFYFWFVTGRLEMNVLYCWHASPVEMWTKLS